MPLVVVPLALALASLHALPAAAEPGHHGHGHGAHATFSAGSPGHAKRPARVVQVTMREADGKMLFSPERLEIRRGEQVRFVLKNIGELDHEFVLATAAENAKHAEEMQQNPHMAHDEPNARRLPPKAAGEIVWRFTRRGEFEFACLIPGHREAGMLGRVTVK